MKRFAILMLAVTVLGIYYLTSYTWLSAFADEPPGTDEGTAIETSSDLTADAALPTKAEARERAEMLHELVNYTLLAVHDNYYREDEGIMIPATALRGVFDRFGQGRKVELRWLAVDAEPMNVEHTPRSDFEREAVKALKSGQTAYDELTADQYRYAGPIRLTSECLKCHVPNRTSTRTRLAAIVVTLPRAVPATDSSRPENK